MRESGRAMLPGQRRGRAMLEGDSARVERGAPPRAAATVECPLRAGEARRRRRTPRPSGSEAAPPLRAAGPARVPTPAKPLVQASTSGGERANGCRQCALSRPSAGAAASSDSTSGSADQPLDRRRSRARRPGRGALSPETAAAPVPAARHGWGEEGGGRGGGEGGGAGGGGGGGGGAGGGAGGGEGGGRRQPRVAVPTRVSRISGSGLAPTPLR